MRDHLEIDPQRCEGIGMCARIAPGLFDADDIPATVRRAPQTDEERELAEDAEVTCPTGAVRYSPAGDQAVGL